MSKDISEHNVITVGLIVTEDMFPLPHKAVITRNFGEKIWLPTDKNGGVLHVVKGDHMELELTAGDLIEWVGTNPFWSEQPRESGSFKKMALKKIENKS